MELNSQGYSQPETAAILQVSLGTVNRDLAIIRKQAQDSRGPSLNLWELWRIRRVHWFRAMLASDTLTQFSELG